jgi:hypothetical protein
VCFVVIRKLLIGNFGQQWWMTPLVIELSLVIASIVIFLVFANRTFRACPKCNTRDRLIDWDGADVDPSPEDEDIWKTKHDADQSAFNENKRRLMTVVLVILGLSLLLFFPFFFVFRD